MPPPSLPIIINTDGTSTKWKKMFHPCDVATILASHPPTRNRLNDGLLWTPSKSGKFYVKLGCRNIESLVRTHQTTTFNPPPSGNGGGDFPLTISSSLVGEYSLTACPVFPLLTISAAGTSPPAVFAHSVPDKKLAITSSSIAPNKKPLTPLSRNPLPLIGSTKPHEPPGFIPIFLANSLASNHQHPTHHLVQCSAN